MKTEKITALLDMIPVGRSKFELDNFLIEAYPTPARRIAAILTEAETLAAKVSACEASLKNVKDEAAVDTVRYLRTSKAKLAQLTEWLSSIGEEEITSALSRYEEEEPEYWSNHLGRKAAIEMLTGGRTRYETMDAMASLPVHAFEEAVRICTRYARLITDTTEAAEQSVQSVQSGLPKV